LYYPLRFAAGWYVPRHMFLARGAWSVSEQGRPGGAFGRGVDRDGEAVRVGLQTIDRWDGRFPAVKSWRTRERKRLRGPGGPNRGAVGTTARGRVVATAGPIEVEAIVTVGAFKVREAGATLPRSRSAPSCEWSPLSWLCRSWSSPSSS